MNVSRRLRTTAVAVALLAPALSSCSLAGVPQTEEIYQPAIGINDRSGQVDVLNAVVVSSGNGTGTLVASLVNQDLGKADTLTGVQGSGPTSGLVVDIAEGSVPLPPDSLVELVDKADITVTGDALRPGFLVELTFTFANAQTVTMNVPVQTPEPPYDEVPLPSATAPATPPATPTATGGTTPAPSGSESP